MHSGQHQVTAPQARALIAAQMPDLAHLPLRRIGLAGTDNVLYRVGTLWVARFPRLPHAAAQIDRQTLWLPRLTPLQLPIPLIQRTGLPSDDYPYRWTLLPWLPGRPATAAFDQSHAALTLAKFLKSLHSLPVPDHAPDLHLSDQLATRFAAIDHFITLFRGEADQTRLHLTAAKLRQLPPYSGPRHWLHGDMHPLNLLVLRGKLTAVIDWGTMGLGDPAMDLMAAWTVFDAPARARFRATLNPAPDTWNRGRALAFAKAVAAIPYYRHSNPALRDVMRLTLTRILAD